MKRKILSLLLLPLCLTAAAEEPLKKLIIWAKDGTQVAYALTENPSVYFHDTYLVVKTGNIEVNYEIEALDKFTTGFVDDDTRISDLNSDGTLKFQDDALIFPALPANSKIRIYSANGNTVLNKTVKAAGEYAVPLSGLDTGVYIVNVNGITYKIMKR